MADPPPEELLGTLDRLLPSCVASGIDDIECYLEYRPGWTLELRDRGQLRESQTLEYGLGVRAICGDQVGFAHTSDLSRSSILATMQAAASIAEYATGTLHVPALTALNPLDPYGERCRFSSEQMAGQLSALQDECRSADPRICSARIRLDYYERSVWIKTSSGLDRFEQRPFHRLTARCKARRSVGLQNGTGGCGGRHLPQRIGPLWQAAVQHAVALACAPDDRVTAPRGATTVVLAPGAAGIVFHEAVGHALEADLYHRNHSLFSGRLGEMIASPDCTLVDDATVSGASGSLRTDDEGVAGQRTVLVEGGRLVGLLTDRISAAALGLKPTGNGRRQSYRHRPLPRMTNTFLAAGELSAAEILRATTRGVYVESVGAGEVDPIGGNFSFTVRSGFLIEDGARTQRIKPTTLVGDIRSLLGSIALVGNDLQLGDGNLHCLKAGQQLPICVGTPTVALTGLALGTNRPLAGGEDV